jgi:seryl-tRNA synthetase
MNDKRRKRVAAAIRVIEAVRDQIINLDSIKEEIEALQSEEQEGFENLPESLQQGEMGQSMEHAAEALGEAVTQLEDAMSASSESFEELLASLNNA